MRFLNISAYKFVAIEAPEGLQAELRQRRFRPASPNNKIVA
jgi:hypothetical protein